jgi:hypothetical protein
MIVMDIVKDEHGVFINGYRLHNLCARQAEEVVSRAHVEEEAGAGSDEGVVFADGEFLE